VIENDLRDLLAGQARTVADDPDRLRSVHARIAGIRRRRTSGAALALVLVALVGLALTRLPGKPATLPAGVPAGPYFGDDGSSRAVPGYRGSGYFRFSGDASWNVSPWFPLLSHVIVARCEHRGDLGIGEPGAAQRRLSCRVPVGDHFEGALPLPAGAGAGGDAGEVAVRPGSVGSWTIGVLEPLFPERITPADVRGSLLTGFGSPSGGRMTVTLPGTVDSGGTLEVAAVCVRDVRLSLSIAGRPLTVVSCDDASARVPGLVTAQVPPETVRILGLRGLQRVTIDVRSVGRSTDQWAILPLG
jgi:hypothetical protein